MSEYFPKSKFLGVRVKVKLDLSNYATKPDSKNGTGVDTSKFAKKADLAHLKSDVDKLDINKFNNAPSNLSNLKSKVDKLNVGKLETTPADLSKLSNAVKNDVVEKTEYNAFAKNADAVQTTNTNILVKKIDYNSKLNGIKKNTDHDHSNKYISTQDFNKLTSQNFTARLASKFS